MCATVQRIGISNEAKDGGGLNHIAERCTCASFEARVSLVSTTGGIVVDLHRSNLCVPGAANRDKQ